MGNGLGPRLRYAIIACIVSAVMLSLMNVAYTNYVDEKSRTTWCDLLTLIDNQSKVPPPTPRTPAQEQYFKLIRELRIQQGCE